MPSPRFLRSGGRGRETAVQRRNRAGLWTLLLASFQIVACGADAPLAPTDELLSLDVRVHLLHSEESEALTTSFEEAAVELLFAEVNRTRAQAGIEWRVGSIVRAAARNGEAFDRILRGEAPATFEAIASVIPTGSLTDGDFDVFLIRNLGGGVGGIYFPGIPAVLQPEVDPLGVAGLDGALTRILAHELGHALGLRHVSCTSEGNLMAPGCEGADRTRLVDFQIRSARSQAATGRPYRGGGPIT